MKVKYEVYVTGNPEAVFKSEPMLGTVDDFRSFLAEKLNGATFIDFKHKNGDSVDIQKSHVSHVKVFEVDTENE